jgi:hypothetical protein
MCGYRVSDKVLSKLRSLYEFSVSVVNERWIVLECTNGIPGTRVMLDLPAEKLMGPLR